MCQQIIKTEVYNFYDSGMRLYESISATHPLPVSAP